MHSKLKATHSIGLTTVIKPIAYSNAPKISGYPLFIPEFVLCTNSSLFWFKIANEHREFRNYLYSFFHCEYVLPVFIDVAYIVHSHFHHKDAKTAYLPFLG